MAVFSFWIFDRHCNCIYSREWTPLEVRKQIPHLNNTTSGSINVRNEDHSAKLLFGALFSLKQISSKLNPSESINNFKSFSTAKYRCHFYESGSGLKFCLLTDPMVENMQFALKEIYTNLFINCVIKNGLSPVDFKENQYINNDTFITGVDNYISSLQAFTT